MSVVCVEEAKTQDNRRRRRCRWQLSSQQDLFETPTLFAGFSVWGNQWNKLMYFYRVWYDHLNLMLSIYDVYRSARCIYEPMLRDGIQQYLPHYVRHVREYVRLKGEEVDSPYSDYTDFPPDPVPDFRGSVMIDSGGFSFGDRGKLARLLTLYRKKLHHDPHDTFASSVVKFAETMLQVVDAEDGIWNEQTVTMLAQKAQEINLSHQLAIQSDFVITLDRVIDDYEYSLERKRRRAFFSVECAKAALAEKARLGERFTAALLAAVHPVGPGPDEIKSLGYRQAYRIFRREFDWYIGQLAEAEENLEIEFDGFGLGSLVPLQEYDTVQIIAVALEYTLRAYGMEDRYLHAFGATNRKASYLFEFGFDSFDTTYHMVRARNRYLYSKEQRSYVSSGDLDSWDCTCPICSNYSLERLREGRSGVKEVATVLHGLHNLYTNHLEAMTSLGL